MSSEGRQQLRGDHPIAHPFTSFTKPPLTPADVDPGSLNDGAQLGTTTTRPAAKRRTHAADIDAITALLSDRDQAILQSVDEHQFLTVRQIEALHFADNAPISGGRIARRTLVRLRGHRLLGTLERRIGGVRAGSGGLVHFLDTVGDQLLHGRPGRQARRRSRDPSTRFLNHRLAIADAHVALVVADRQGLLELVDFAAEPTSWRRFTNIGGARLTLKPDLYTETATAGDGDFVHAWFVEVDLATEGIETLLKKCRDYEAYRRTGIEQEDGGGFPLVVWSVTHPDPTKAARRRQALREAIDRDRTLEPALFRVVRPDQLVPLLANGGAV
jgi:hypothetical protein